MLTRQVCINALVSAGLRISQAKVYLTLLSLRQAGATSIWKNSDVARQDIYRILTELHDIGMVEKIISQPTEYKAVPIEEGVSILLKHNMDQYTEAKEKTKILLQEYKNIQKEEKLETSHFIIVPTKEVHKKRINQMFATAQKSIDTIMIHQGITPSDPEELPPPLKNAIIRGVKVRHLSYESADINQTPSKIWKKQYTYEIRYLHDENPVMFCIADNKELFLALTPKPKPKDTEILWTNNPTLIKISKNYFDITWQNTPHTTN